VLSWGGESCRMRRGEGREGEKERRGDRGMMKG
jgi:hypothetical protein